ncbi:MAG: hypothetical protein KatS3mg113_0582 [Planctomycetaceae bacterium]|nr:MAG: hypothetical protein KatS3mg113_0582 [Planctomycetaceae bacterium]
MRDSCEIWGRLMLDLYCFLGELGHFGACCSQHLKWAIGRDTPMRENTPPNRLSYHRLGVTLCL